jgi:trehalose-6-phosphate synthase
MADAILTALEMDRTERIERHGRLLAAVKAQDIFAWSNAFLAALDVRGKERRAVSFSNASMRHLLDRLEHKLKKPERGASRARSLR